MKEKGYPLQGILTPAPSEEFPNSEERTLLGVDQIQRLILCLQVFHMTAWRGKPLLTQSETLLNVCCLVFVANII